MLEDKARRSRLPPICKAAAALCGAGDDQTAVAVAGEHDGIGPRQPFQHLETGLAFFGLETGYGFVAFRFHHDLDAEQPGPAAGQRGQIRALEL